jgi:parallel beta-helix repeat protein
MRKQIPSLLAVLCLSVSVQASTYYLAASGKDSRTPAQAQSKLSPWKTITHLNSYFSSLSPGDSILFNRGDTFSGILVIQKSGTQAQPIVMSCYGNTSKPLPQFSALIRINGWVNVGNGIWQCPCPNAGRSENMVLLNGVFQAEGRYPNSSAPNKGYLNFESHVGSGQITDNELSSAQNWSGAELVIRPNRWVLDRDSITSHSGTTIHYNSTSGYTPLDGFGYFIQNHISTLDVPGEWFYDPTAKKMNMFFGNSSPSSSNIQMSVQNNLVSCDGYNNIVFNKLMFTGANQDAINLHNASNISILNCVIRFSGANAVTAADCKSLQIESNSISETNNTALCLFTSCSNSSVRNNKIMHTGIHAGMGQSGNDTYDGILISGNTNAIESNTIDSTGYIGINFIGDSILIRNNFLNYFTQTKDDGGGIYTWTGAANLNPSSKRRIEANVILNGTGAGEGTDNPSYRPSEGIYMDDNTSSVEIIGNTVANCGDKGIFLHNAHDIDVHGNTSYNNKGQLEMGHDGICPNCLIRNNSITGNIFFSKWVDQNVINLTSIGSDIVSFGAFDSNYYCRPYDDNLTLSHTAMASSASQLKLMEDLQMWQADCGQDGASAKSPETFPSYTLTGYTGTNMDVNGTFSANIDGLYTYSPAGNEIAAYDNSGKLDGGALRFSFSPASGLPNISKIIIAAGSVTAGKNYVLKFSLLGSKNNKTMNVFLRQSQSPYNTLHTPATCKISNTRTEMQFLFSPLVSESNTSLIFEIGEADSTLWLDNITLYEAQVAMSNPDDNILFEYNTGASVKNISLTGTYTDARKQTYQGSLNLAPYTSVILMKQAFLTGLPEMPLNVPGQMLAYPNPARDLLAISLEGDELEGKAELYDLSGKLFLSKTIYQGGGNPFQLELNELPPAMYILKVSTAKQIYQKMIVIQKP